MSQESKVVSTLREMILAGKLEAGQRILEVPLSEQLGISRTPVRFALAVLAAEGLIVGGQKRGYHVRNFTMKDITDAIAVRGALEGVAARTLAENRPGEAVRRGFADCLAAGDALLEKGHIAAGDDQLFEAMNRKFHTLIIEGAGNGALAAAIATNDRLPFAAAGAVAVETRPGQLSPSQYQFYFLAHMQHRLIVEAIEAGQSGRAEALMQEHANVAKKNILWLGEQGRIDLRTRTVGERAAVNAGAPAIDEA
ncbi:GntR family transcriptional regulator [Paraburkholderia acidisoli]|uniref:FCD domain-containing protein n=1 Tax=Paraburkholderia acidisoli TaxID=2571748 RepID=A0A7Z2GRR9_9BURK|nr:GntR family transcriptional regulator [Paraburkholderia acidisoli]QGZ66763.1 FCD domain-containing protein [Paraburkholderia acidisoli]